MSDGRYDARAVSFYMCSRMRALADTMGMSEPQKAKFWLGRLAHDAHRGPGVDTWTSARDRVAKDLDIPRSMAERIWVRWRDMKDVSGVALMRLMLAYDRMCLAAETKAAGMRGERIRIGEDCAVIAAARGNGCGVDHAGHCQA